jgi:hypothetical protein
MATPDEPVELSSERRETAPAALDDNLDLAVWSARPVRTMEGFSNSEGSQRWTSSTSRS